MFFGRINLTNKILFLTSIITIIYNIYFYGFQRNQKIIMRNQEKLKELNYDVNFDYSNYERNIITKEIIKNSGWQLELMHAYFINGIIRKLKPKKCLEIGVSNGGSSILILNAIKDIKDSFLISLDINTQMYLNTDKKTGYRVYDFFPDLTKKWKLFTGDLPHKFLVQLNETFDFLFLDTAHMAIKFYRSFAFFKGQSYHDIT